MPKIQMPDKESIKKFSTEQIAGLILFFLQRNMHQPTSYSSNYLLAIKEFEIAPLWLGRNVVNGITPDFGGYQVYHGENPSDLDEIYQEAVNMLKNKEIIYEDPTQTHSRDFVCLSKNGKSMTVNDDFTLRLQKDPWELRKQFQDSVFRVEVEDINGDKHQGTAFILNNRKIITCLHVIEAGNWTIQTSTKNFSQTDFICKKYKELDIAILEMNKDMILDIKGFKKLNPLPIDGEEIISFGFPTIPDVQDAPLNTEIGNITSISTDYRTQNKTIVLSSYLNGGYSGGPIINRYGEILGVITKNTSFSQNSERITTQREYTHALPISLIPDIPC